MAQRDKRYARCAFSFECKALKDAICKEKLADVVLDGRLEPLFFEALPQIIPRFPSCLYSRNRLLVLLGYMSRDLPQFMSPS